MKTEEKPMLDRMIRILNRIINKCEGYYSIDNIIEYCKDIKEKLEKEKEK